MKVTPKEFFQKAYRILIQFGLDPLRLLCGFREFPFFLIRWFRFRFSFLSETGNDFPSGFRFFPQLGDRKSGAGVVATHYFQLDLHVAQLIFEQSPKKHLDVGSRIDGFVAHVASFRAIEVLDIRPLTNHRIHNISFRQADLMDATYPWETEACDSVSCLHVLEHFGLGRYGDPINPCAHEIGFKNLARLVEPSGILYLAVPISSRPRIEFDAHRVFGFPYLRNLVGIEFEIESVALVSDQGVLMTDLKWNDVGSDSSWGCHYGCVILSLRKKNSPRDV